MEHRYSSRFSLEIEVILDHQALGTLRGVARDLSSDGMYIESIERPLPLNAMFNVRFQFGENEYSEEVIVIHSSRKGTGVLFNHPLSLSALQNKAV